MKSSQHLLPDSLTANDKAILIAIFEKMISDYFKKAFQTDESEQIPGYQALLVPFETMLLRKGYEACRYNQSELAKRLGIGRHTLRKRLEQHQLYQPASHRPSRNRGQKK